MLSSLLLNTFLIYNFTCFPKERKKLIMRNIRLTSKLKKKYEFVLFLFNKFGQSKEMKIDIEIRKKTFALIEK